MFLLRDDITEISALLLRGGIICCPTDTVWGLSCAIDQPDAIAKIKSIKGDPPQNGYIILVDSIEMLKDYVAQMPPRLETLLSFHARPLTMVYKYPQHIPTELLAKDGSAAIRVATDEFCQTLIAACGCPLLTTTACRMGGEVPPTFGAINSDILGAVDYVVRYRQDDKTPQLVSPLAKLDNYQELEFIRE
jgi:L-threonylcarbamoyladenylate synthase